MNPDTEVQCYGVSKRSAASDTLQACAEEIRRNGFSALEGVFSAEEMSIARQKIDEVYAIQVKESGGAATLESANDEDIARCPLAYDRFFLDLARKPEIHAVMRAILGESYVLMMQNAIINRSSKRQYQVRWHRDLNYQHWTSTQPMALNFLVCVDDFTAQGGGTYVLPASHHVAEFPSDAFVRKFQQAVERKSGSVVILDAMTFHRSGHNRIPEFVRRAVNHVVGLPFMGQQIDMPKFLAERGLDYSSDPALAAFLGYRWNPAPNPAAWRSARLPRA